VLEISLCQQLLERVSGAIAVHAKGTRPGDEERFLNIGPAKGHHAGSTPLQAESYAEFE
jgi:hypothetical protein